MNKIVFGGLIISLLAIFVSSSVEQEFIKQPKEKKFYPSCQQYTELNAEIVDLSNQLLAVLSGFVHNVIDAQRNAITEINQYVDGDKDCFVHNATKKERAEGYAQKMKIKVKLQEVIRQLLIINGQSDTFITTSSS